MVVPRRIGMTNVYVVTYNEKDGYDGTMTSVEKVFYNREDAITYVNRKKETVYTWYDYEVVEIE